MHPLVSVIDLSTMRSPGKKAMHLSFGVYAVFLKESVCGELRYGRTTYDYAEGTLVFLAPGQFVQITNTQPDALLPTTLSGYPHPDRV